MKKVVSLLLALVVLCSMSIPALADDGDKAAELILIAKNTFQISDDLFVFENYSKSEQDGQKATYHLWWTTRNEDEYAMRQDSISVNIREDGVIETYRFHKDSDYTNDRQLPKHSKEEAQAAADAFSAKVNSDRAAQVRLEKIEDADQYSNSYTVRYTRYANDIPVMSDGIDISVDAQTLEPVSYSASWSDVTFADPAGAITPDAAKAAYKEKLGYELVYEFVNRDNKDVPILVYRTKYSVTDYIDAMTGEVFQPSSYYEGYAMDAAVANTKSASGGAMAESARLSEEEEAFVAEVEQMITRSQAEAIARGVKEFEITSDFTSDSYRVYKGYDDQYVVRISFTKPENDGKDASRKQVSIDAKTSQVIAYYDYDWAQIIKSSYNPTIVGAEAKKTAEAFLNAHYAEQFAQTLPENTLNPQEDSTSFVYDRIVNDIRVIGNGINISIDGETGKISSFNLRWTTQDFPATGFVKPIDMLYKAVLADYAPAYHVQTVYDEAAKAAKTESHLVYRVKSENLYGAETLFVIDYNGYPVDTQEPAYSDIAGHWSEAAANRLLEIGVYFPGGSLMPEQPVTQTEFLKLVAQVVNGRNGFSTDTELLRYFINMGVLERDEIHNPGQEISRLEGVRYLLNAMGFKKAAVIPGIYNCPFADVTAAPDTGYAAIASGLGLVSTKADKFKPNNTLTRAQALTMLFNYLNK